MKIKRGSTSVRRLIFIADSSSTTGAGLTGLVYNSASLVWYYFAGDLSNEVAVTLATATLGTWTSGGFVEVDATNMPGWYEIGIPNAALDGGIECAMQLRGATNMVPVNVYIELDAFDYQTATQPVNLTQIGGDTQSATDLKDFADAGYDPATNKLTGAVELDPAARVKLDASQPDYAPATAASVAAEAVKTTAIQTKTDNLPSDPADQSLIVAATDAVMTRLGAPAGASIAADIAAIDGGVGGDATLAKQEEILTAVESVVDTVAAYAARMALEVQLRGFPNVICRNADYLIATESEIRITIEDLTGAAITEIAGTPVASLSWLFGMGTEADPSLIAGTCTWDAGTDELVIEIAKAATTGKQTGSLTWQIGVSIGTARRWLGGGTTRLIERHF